MAGVAPPQFEVALSLADEAARLASFRATLGLWSRPSRLMSRMARVVVTPLSADVVSGLACGGASLG